MLLRAINNSLLGLCTDACIVLISLILPVLVTFRSITVPGVCVYLLTGPVIVSLSLWSSS